MMQTAGHDYRTAAAALRRDAAVHMAAARLRLLAAKRLDERAQREREIRVKGFEPLTSAPQTRRSEPD